MNSTEGNMGLIEFSLIVLLKLWIEISPSNAEILSLISFCIPIPTPTETIITIIPIEIAATPIFIIGAEILFL